MALEAIKADILANLPGWKAEHEKFGKFIAAAEELVGESPDAIDAEDEDAFHERWIWLLSKASVGQLRQPSTMPIKQWPPTLV